MHLLIRTDCDTQIFVDPCRLAKMPHINIVFLQCFKQFHTGNIRSARSCSLVHSLVFMIFSVVCSKYARSRIDAVPNAMVIRSIVYELKEYFTSFKYLISVGLLMAKPILDPARERDLENVCTTITLSYLSIRGRALSPPKSIYASSTITSTSGFA